jgi:thioredoxin-like negative regulator of GroEL
MRFLVVLLALACADAAADDLYVFWRPGCSPCERLKAAMASDPTLTAGYDVYLVNTKEHPGLASRHRVSGVPVLILMRDGKELKRRVGFAGPDELRDWVRVETRRFRK